LFPRSWAGGETASICIKELIGLTRIFAKISLVWCCSLDYQSQRACACGCGCAHAVPEHNLIRRADKIAETLAAFISRDQRKDAIINTRAVPIQKFIIFTEIIADQISVIRSSDQRIRACR